ncbi:AEC family transporter [Marinivivus vitaminiproducens]|uniref:AEC family transporter n=1 Tax=Marinivivus vitaminiproducens TaxID=3035935 RepID=UPI0027A128BC|nr:AEC family transporter [Geminicoccaceae bacterium SCSIO 64248]
MGAIVIGLVAAKLLLHPALVALCAFVLIPLAAAEAQAATVMASLPTAATVFVLAQRYRTEAETVATAILVGHLASVVTVSGLLVAFL